MWHVEGLASAPRRGEGLASAPRPRLTLSRSSYRARNSWVGQVVAPLPRALTQRSSPLPADAVVAPRRPCTTRLPSPPSLPPADTMFTLQWMKANDRWRRLGWRLAQPTYATWVGSTVITLALLRSVVSSAGPSDTHRAMIAQDGSYANRKYAEVYDNPLYRCVPRGLCDEALLAPLRGGQGEGWLAAEPIQRARDRTPPTSPCAPTTLTPIQLA